MPGKTTTMALESLNLGIVRAQAIELPDLSGLPLIVQGVFYTVFAVGVTLVVLIPRMGWLSGKANGPAVTPVTSPTIAAVVVDPTALNAHTAALLVVAKELDELKTELHIIREVGIKIRRAGS